MKIRIGTAAFANLQNDWCLIIGKNRLGNWTACLSLQCCLGHRAPNTTQSRAGCDPMRQCFGQPFTFWATSRSLAEALDKLERKIAPSRKTTDQSCTFAIGPITARLLERGDRLQICKAGTLWCARIFHRDHNVLPLWGCAATLTHAFRALECNLFDDSLVAQLLKT